MQNFVYNTVTTTAFSPLNPKAKVKKIVVFPPTDFSRLGCVRTNEQPLLRLIFLAIVVKKINKIKSPPTIGRKKSQMHLNSQKHHHAVNDHR